MGTKRQGCGCTRYQFGDQRSMNADCRWRMSDGQPAVSGWHTGYFLALAPALNW